MKNQEYDDIRIPKQLSEAVSRGIENGKRIRRRKHLRKVCSIAGGMAAALCVFSMYCFANPTFAAELPLIGGIFKQVENKSAFPGDYSKKAENLSEQIQADVETELPRTENETEEIQEKVQEKMVELYGDTDQKITVTPVEAYCDGSSLYLAMEMKNGYETGFGEGHTLTDVEGNQLDYDQIQVMGTWSDGTATHKLSDGMIIAEQPDRFTFLGRTKILLEDLPEGTEKIQIQFTHIWWQDLTEKAAEYATMASSNKTRVCMEGEWNLEVPVKVDPDSVKNYQISDTNEQGFGIENVIVTPYEIRIQRAVPELNEQLLADVYNGFEKLCREQLGEEGAEKFLVETLFDSTDLYWHGGFSVFNQDGERLEYGAGYDQGEAVEEIHQTEMKEVTKLYFYLMPDDVTAFKCQDQELAKKCNIYSYELDLQE